MNTDPVCEFYTSQAAKYALCRPDARVVGIDISPTSLDQTEWRIQP